ncbi:hypothetical protein SAMN05444162_1332 [Paenibacillaceae bacterium GAS479]|nr:hypothetical protein SAMN05444162_1332 [Paenibacillaceae bacterium GAS479]
MNEINQRATISGRNTGWNLGFILVLFILVVIVNSIFCTPSRAGNGPNEDSVSTAASRNFNIYNLTGDLILTPVDLYGDFEPPGPEYVPIPPGEGQGFEVKYAAGSTYAAFARYITTNGNIVTLTMRTKTGAAEIAVSFLTAGLTSFTDNGTRTAYIYRKY